MRRSAWLPSSRGRERKQDKLSVSTRGIIRMSVYKINLDMLEAAKEEHERAARRMADAAETIHGVVSAAGEEVYQGADADTLREGLTGYADTALAEEGERIAYIGRALGGALEDGRKCKKICNDFPLSLGGTGNGKQAEDMAGDLCCDMEKIVELKSLCNMAMADADTIRREADEIDSILSELQMVSMDSGQYTDRIRAACDRVDLLEQHSYELGIYALGAEGVDESLCTALAGCVPDRHAKAIACVSQRHDPGLGRLEHVLRQAGGELTEEERETIDRELEKFIREEEDFRLEQAAALIGKHGDGEWTGADAYLSARLIAHGEKECKGGLLAIVYGNLVHAGLSEARDDSHMGMTRTDYIYTASFDDERVEKVLGMLDPQEEALAYHSLDNRRYYCGRVDRMVYGDLPQEPGADFSVSFMEKEGRLVSVMELDGEMAVYESSETDVVDRWLMPDCRLNKKEEAHAKELAGGYFSDRKLLKEAFRCLGTGELGKLAILGSGITEEEYREGVRMYQLAMKTDDLNAFSSGMVHALPFVDTVLGNIPGDTMGNYNNIRAQADLQSPDASGAGELAGNVLEFWLGSKLMKAVRALGKRWTR